MQHQSYLLDLRLFNYEFELRENNKCVECARVHTLILQISLKHQIQAYLCTRKSMWTDQDKQVKLKELRKNIGKKKLGDDFRTSCNHTPTTPTAILVVEPCIWLLKENGPTSCFLLQLSLDGCSKIIRLVNSHYNHLLVVGVYIRWLKQSDLICYWSLQPYSIWWSKQAYDNWSKVVQLVTPCSKRLLMVEVCI